MYDYHSMFRAVEIRNENGVIMLFDAVIVCTALDGFKFGDKVQGVIIDEQENGIVIIGKDREYYYALKDCITKTAV